MHAEALMTTIPAPFQPTPRLLLGPGPSDAHPAVLRAMATPLLGHLDPQFLRVLDEVQAMLRAAFRTGNALTLPISATGMAGMETCLVNLLEPGDRAVVCAAGFFGQRLAEVAGRAGAQVTVLERPWGEVFDPGQVREALQKVRPRVLGIVQAETSTGAWRPLEGLGALCREHEALLVVDAVTALGSVPLPVDEWGIDAVYSCSQKGLGCPPGLAPVSLGARAVEAVERRKARVQSWYLDVTLLRRYFGQERAYHHTAPISMNYALREALALVVEEGLETRFERHALNGRALHAGLSAMGLTLLTDPKHRLPQLTCVKIPDGVDDLVVRRRLLRDWGIEVGGGLGPHKGQAWRIGLMGHGSRQSSVTLLLAALETCLRDLGVSLPAGEATRAAAAVYAEAAK